MLLSSLTCVAPYCSQT